MEGGYNNKGFVNLKFENLSIIYGNYEISKAFF